MNRDLPWFPFYARDWLLSRTVRLLTYEQKGVYIDLLANAWDWGGDGEPCLPNDPRALAQLLGLQYPQRWRKVAQPLIDQCFVEREGRLYNDKLSHVWEVQTAKRAIAAMAGRASAEKRKGNVRSTAGATPGQRTLPGRSPPVAADGQRTVSERSTENQPLQSQTQSQRPFPQTPLPNPLAASVGAALQRATDARRDRDR
jgi:uncharacterized protein YdaU (DUF1376 family)